MKIDSERLRSYGFLMEDGAAGRERGRAAAPLGCMQACGGATAFVSQYVYMHTNTPLYSEYDKLRSFDTGHVNSILWLDFLNLAFFLIQLHGICRY